MFPVKTFNTQFADGKKKIFATMFINNVTYDDDSMFAALGSYECHGFVVGKADAQAEHGFSVSVIRSKSYTLVYFSF